MAVAIQRIDSLSLVARLRRAVTSPGWRVQTCPAASPSAVPSAESSASKGCNRPGTLPLLPGPSPLPARRGKLRCVVYWISRTWRPAARPTPILPPRKSLPASQTGWQKPPERHRAGPVAPLTVHNRALLFYKSPGQKTPFFARRSSPKRPANRSMNETIFTPSTNQSQMTQNHLRKPSPIKTTQPQKNVCTC